MALLLLVAAPGVFAKSTFTIDPLNFLAGSVLAEFETDLGDGPLTVAIPARLLAGRTTEIDLVSMGTGAGVRYYIDGQAHEGFYFGAYGFMDWLSGVYYFDYNDTMDFTGTYVRVSGVAGYKLILGDRLVLDMGASVVVPVAMTLSMGGLSATQVGGTFGTNLTAAVGISF